MVGEVVIEVGDVLLRYDHEIRVMAVAKNWLMVRRKGCSPFVIDLNSALTLPIAKKGIRPKGWKLETV